MKILSIETSCDDTGITIMEAKGSTTNASFKVLADSSNSQIKVHIPYGGVYPALAKREHTKNLPILLERVLNESRLNELVGQAKLNRKVRPVDAVAVTYGPGLEMCLWEGVTFAKNLAKKWDVPLIPTNHMEGHILSVFGKNKASPVGLPSGIALRASQPRGKFLVSKPETPILSLLVSGGHTQLVLSKKWMQYEIIGESLDDAVGEAFDKVARMLGLPYPGGPQISRLAEEARISRERSIAQTDEPSIAIREHANMRAESARNSGFSLPRPMLYSKNFDFSFSGLKTAVLYLIKKIGPIETLDEKTKAKIALEFENAAIECLIYKTAKAIEQYKIKTLIIGGGVACNKHLQREMKKITNNKKNKLKLLLPQKELTGDNSLMIGIAGYLQYIKNKKKVPKIDSVKAIGNLRL